MKKRFSMGKRWVYLGLFLASLGFSQTKDWEELLAPANRGEYERMLTAYQNMDFGAMERSLSILFQKEPTNAVILFSYLVFAQMEGFGRESIQNGLAKNLSAYISKSIRTNMPLGDFLLSSIANPRDRLVSLIELESNLRYVNWFLRLEIIKEHVNRNRDYDAALDKLNDLIQRYPQYPILWYYRLLFYAKQKNWESFDREAKTTLKKFPKHPEILRICGQTARERKRLDEAISYYEKALQANPNWHADGALELITLYLDTQQQKKAASLLPRARKLYPWKQEFGILEQKMLFGLW